MFVRVIRYGSASVPAVAGSRHLHQCQHIQIESLMHIAEGKPPVQVGIEVSLSPGPTFRLPRDCDAVFIMNDRGDTVDAYRWPPRAKTADSKSPIASPSQSASLQETAP